MSKLRTQLLFEPEQHRKLQDIAEYEQRSLSDIVREAVDVFLADRSASSRIERGGRALDRAAALRSRMRNKRRGKPMTHDLPDVLDELREEQDARTLDARKDDGSESDRH